MGNSTKTLCDFFVMKLVTVDAKLSMQYVFNITKGINMTIAK